jgi:hypothetical protein
MSLVPEASAATVDAPQAQRVAPDGRPLQAPPPPRIKVLYIAGWQRSGSTILANLLGAIDGFCSSGELFSVWGYVWEKNVLCGCGQPFHACPHWSAIVRDAFGAPERIDAARMWTSAQHVARTRQMHRLLLSGKRRRLLAELRPYLADLARLYRSIRAVSGCRVIVDSSKWPSYGSALDALDELDVRVVHLVRDPRAVAYSWTRRKALPDRDPPEEMYRSPRDSSVRWNAWNVAAEAFWRAHPERYLRLRYEDFVARPRESVEHILRFAGEPIGRLPFTGEHSLELGVSHTVSGNPVRLRTGPVELRPDDEWKQRMERGDRALVTALTLPLLLRYRYPVLG